MGRATWSSPTEIDKDKQIAVFSKVCKCFVQVVQASGQTELADFFLTVADR